MTVKLAILKSGEDVVADIKEMVVGEGDSSRVVGYVLTKPVSVSLNRKEIIVDDEEESFEVRLIPWCPLTKSEKIPITADWVVTIVDPIDKITAMYKKEVLGDADQSVDSDEQTDSDKSN